MLDRATAKLYYEDRYLASCLATVVNVTEGCIELDRTVAFPEGGGQESDQGIIRRLGDGSQLRFVGAKKMYGTPLRAEGIPDVSIGGVIWHLIHPEDQTRLLDFKAGDEIAVEIDAVRRERLSLSHTASHLVYLGVQRWRPDAFGATLGCHIRTDGARFDFAVKERLTPGEVQQITQTANEYVAANARVETYPHVDYPDARFWRCEGAEIPCGGTHLDATGAVGTILVKRRGMGTGKERLSCEFPSAVIDVSRYHVEAGKAAADPKSRVDPSEQPFNRQH
jgi:alanyl-tRNA synthetase